MADISTLNIQITAGTSTATTNIDKLIAKLSELNKALSKSVVNPTFIKGLNDLGTGFAYVGASANKVDVTKLGAISKAFNRIASSSEKASKVDFSALVSGLHQLDSVYVSADQFAGLKTLSSSLDKIVSKNIGQAAYALPSIASGLASLSSVRIPEIGPQLTELAKGLGQLGYSKNTQAAQNLPIMAEALRKFGSISIPAFPGLGDLAKKPFQNGKQGIDFSR